MDRRAWWATVHGVTKTVGLGDSTTATTTTTTTTNPVIPEPFVEKTPFAGSHCFCFFINDQLTLFMWGGYCFHHCFTDKKTEKLEGG